MKVHSEKIKLFGLYYVQNNPQYNVNIQIMFSILSRWSTIAESAEKEESDTFFLTFHTILVTLTLIIH